MANEINNKQQEGKAERKAERAKRTKKEKYTFCFLLFSTLTIVFLAAIMIIALVKNDVLYQDEIENVLCVLGVLTTIFFALTLWFGCLFDKEIKREEEREFKKKEALINSLSKNEFKKIKLEETENEYFNAFLGNTTIEAKIHPDNKEIVIVKFYFVNDGIRSYSKEIPFSRECLTETINEVL